MNKIKLERLFHAFTAWIAITLVSLSILKITPFEFLAGVFLVLLSLCIAIPLATYCYSKPIIFRKTFEEMQKAKQAAIEAYKDEPFPFRA